ncbi:hypothetical protein TTHERM_00678040 (macronuclear) [Tetrahymena thermophila SB210]|uniref:Uncharacterized protein n=1 Tax=Tetrahymena thermophila (strain SB210) TaxID=312017 RepID=I7LY26_TETTS|nr:hypothetical protein TTHERM_00678040 [Tetrahymena thermophila SB210]EAS07538.2 hypothetical protein TTHERM_00678040 [Tetrahymena thermophila SB210]|eukprot:XP_001027780.2 hypothetical protein TTHERM_00678040 [Tetrahymena thermophila SB210]
MEEQNHLGSDGSIFKDDNLDNIFSQNKQSVNEEIMCKQHKSKVEFVCLSCFCSENKYLCPKCYRYHQNHSEYVQSLDSYQQTILEREYELFNQRKQTFTERIQQMKRVIYKIQKSIDKYEENEMKDIQAHFEEVNLRCKEDKHKFLKDFCDPHYDTNKLFTTPLFSKEINYQKIQDTAQNLLNQIERKEYNIQNLIGYLIRQDNFFDIVQKHENQSHQNAHMGDNQQQGDQQNQNQSNNVLSQNELPQVDANILNQQNNQNFNGIIQQAQDEEPEGNQENNEEDDDDQYEDDDEDDDYLELWLSDSDISSEMQNERKITSISKYNSNILVFCNTNSVYYYDFVNRKILYHTKFTGNVQIIKIIKLSQEKMAILVSREFLDTQLLPGVITFEVFYEVLTLKIQNRKIQKRRIYAEKRGYEIRDIFEVKNSQLIAIVQEEQGILILNSLTGKVISKYKSDIEFDVPFEGIYSCTMLYNVKYDGVFYKYLIALNLIDGSYGLWDFIGNKYIKRKNFVHNIGLNYKFSTSVRIKDAFNVNSKKLNNKYQIDDSDEENIIDDQQLTLIVIQGDRNETYLQRDYDGQLEVKMHHRLIDFFDLFYNQSAIPFYHNNSIFFYDFIQKKRIKTISLHTKFSISAYLQQNQLSLQQNQLNHSNNQTNTSGSYQAQELLQNYNRGLNIENSNQNMQTSANQNNINNNQIYSNSLIESQINQSEEDRKCMRSQNLSLNQNNQDIQNDDLLSQSQLSIASKQKERNSQIPSQRSSKQKKEIKQVYPQNNNPKQNIPTFSQIWEESLLQFQQNQTNNNQSTPFEYFQQNQQQSSLNENQFNNQLFNSIGIQQRREVDTLNYLNFGNQQARRNFQNQILNPQQQNDLLQHNNYKLFDICPIAIINHFEFILVIFPNGVIQYIK